MPFAKNDKLPEVKSDTEKAIQEMVFADVDKIHLEVNERSENAMRLYRRYGFREDGRRKHYYSDGGDAVLMTLVI